MVFNCNLDGLSDDDDEDDDGLVDGSTSSGNGSSGDADDFPEVTPEEAALFEAMENEP